MPSNLSAVDTGFETGVEFLQERLGVDEDQARDLANIEVACPVPGEDC